MKILEMHLKGFGKFSDKTVALDRGLNIIFGSNEAGKSTIHRFIEAMFFGFIKPGVKRRILLDDHERYRPWIGEFYEGSMVYETADGAFRVERNLLKGRESVAVFDNTTGEDITAGFDYDKNRREPLFCQQHLGINQTVYKNTISISQLGSKSDDELAREVGTQLSNMFASGDMEISVARAEKTIRDYMESIGTERAYTKEYGKLCRCRDELEDRMFDAIKKTESLREHQYRLNGMEERMGHLEAEYLDVQGKIRCAEDFLLLRRWEDIKALKDREGQLLERLEHLAGYSEFDDSDSREVFTMNELIDREKSRLDQMSGRIAGLCGRIEELNDKLKAGGNMDNAEQNCLELRSYFSRYSELKDRRDKTIQEIRGLEKQLREIRDGFDVAVDGQALLRAEKIQDEMDKSGMELESQEYYRLKLEREKTARDCSRIMGIVLFSGAALTASVVLSIIFEPLLLIGVLASAILCLFGLRGLMAGKTRLSEQDKALSEIEKGRAFRGEQLRKNRAELEDIFNRYGVHSMYEIRAKYREYERLTERVHDLEERIADRYGALDSGEREIKRTGERMLEILEGAGIDAGREVDNCHVEEYLNRIEAYRKVKDELNDLSRQRDNLDCDYRQRSEELQEKQARMNRMLRHVGADDVEEYRHSLECCNELREIRRQLEETRRLIEIKLDGEEYQSLMDRASAIGHSGGPPAEEYDRDVLAVLLSRREDIKEAQGEIAAAIEKTRGSMETLMENYITPAEIEEELGTIKNRLEELDAERSAASIALEMIKEAASQVHREFAPLLNERVRQVVRAVTGGRYRDLRITGDLEIYAISPETGRQVSIKALSGGTVDQFYFACRMGIADLLSGERRLPLILDDSFVQYDMGRLENVMEYLLDASRERQVIIFTCHGREKEVADRFGRGYNYVEL